MLSLLVRSIVFIKKCSSESASHGRTPLRGEGRRPFAVTVTLIGLE